ncbi:MAG: bifunctional folylpolyglutamate synthase/dihydrofolate synthase [Oscillospiraceae bacterium]|nr:bifunctional folylpolyglutamate synthase/dihydrofolate synthase [Oscillospiraceae bacterium]
MTIEETLEYITKVQWRERKPGLDRIRELLAAVGDPHLKTKYVHVAGTNGKGSTSACLASVLKKAGYKTGLFISPYVIRYNERMQCNGEYITDEELIAYTEELRVYADAMEEPPTVYEITTALGFMFFARRECDIVVLEVGMGGELDATNIIDLPEVAVITTIGYDHVEELGPTLADIASAKAGIIKGGDVVIYGGTDEVEAVFEEVCVEKNAKLHKADYSRITNVQVLLEGNKFDFEPYGEITVALTGTYQINNATVVITALEVLREKGYNISDDDIKSGLAGVYWPGRMEVLGHNPVFILDGSHNPEAAEVTAESLIKIFPDKKIVILMGVMADKDVDAMISYIAPITKAFVACTPDYEGRAMEAKTLAEKLSAYTVPVLVANSFDEAINHSVQLAGIDGVVCTFGSLYLSPSLRDAYNRVNGINSEVVTGNTLCVG